MQNFKRFLVVCERTLLVHPQATYCQPATTVKEAETSEYAEHLPPVETILLWNKTIKFAVPQTAPVLCYGIKNENSQTHQPKDRRMLKQNNGEVWEYRCLCRHNYCFYSLNPLQTWRASRCLPHKTKGLPLPSSIKLFPFSSVSFSVKCLSLEGSTGPHTAQPIFTKHLTSISKVISRNGSYVSETAWQFKHFTGIKIQMLNTDWTNLKSSHVLL